MSVGQLDSHLKEDRITSIYHTIHKNNSKGIRDLNVKNETTKYQGKTWVNFSFTLVQEMIF